jgi:hypothetical protein
MHRPPFVLYAMLGVSLSGPLDAQSVSLQVGISSFGADREPEVGVRLSPAAHDVVGMDFSFDVYPRALAFGTVAGMTDLSFAVRVRPAPAVALVGRAGGSALLGLGGEGMIVLTGYHAGVGIVVTADARTTVRLDYAYRRLRETGETYPVPSVTFGFMVHQ